jgi:hypothetical protein
MEKSIMVSAYSPPALEYVLIEDGHQQEYDYDAPVYSVGKVRNGIVTPLKLRGTENELRDLIKILEGLLWTS